MNTTLTRHHSHTPWPISVHHGGGACSSSARRNTSTPLQTKSKSTATKTTKTTKTTSTSSTAAAEATLIHGINGVPFWQDVYDNSTWWNVSCSVQAGVKAFADLSAAIHLNDAWTSTLNAWKASIGNATRPQKLDEWIWQNWNQGNFPDCFDTDASQCDNPPACNENEIPSAISVIMTEMSGVHRSAAQDKQAYEDALNNLKISEYAETFTKLPEKSSSFDWMSFLEILGFVVPGLMGMGLAGRGITTLSDGAIQSARSVLNQATRMGDEASEAVQKAKSVLAAAEQAKTRWADFTKVGAIMGSESAIDNAKNSVDPMDEVVTKLESYIKSVVTSTIEGLSNYLEEMFDATNETTQDLWTSIIEGGTGWDMKANRDDETTTLNDISATLYAGMLPFAWSVSTEALYPVLLRLDKDKYGYTCGNSIDNTPADQKKPSDYITFGIGELIWEANAKKAMVCDPDGNTFMLVNARYSVYDCAKTRTGCMHSTEDSMPFVNLPGIDVDTLNGDSPWYMNYTKLVRGLWGGFLNNNMRNGWSMETRAKILNDAWTEVEDAPMYYNGYEAAGFINATVCLNGDEAVERMAKGLYPPCPEQPDEGAAVYTMPDNDAGWASGWCTMHFSKVQRDEDYINPTNEYLMAVTILDHNKKIIIHVPLQPIDDAFVITDEMSGLGANFTVRAGNDDDAEDEFWYKDLYWKSKDSSQQCSDGKWDSGFREGNCGFTCSPDPVTGSPSTAPPSDARTVWLGNPDASLTEQSNPSFDVPGVSSYESGTCYVHIWEWQQNVLGQDNYYNPGTYSQSVAVYDNKDNLIAFAPDTHGSVMAQGPLPYIVICNQMDGGDGADVDCVYAGQNWTMGGKFKNDHRKLKHDFDC